MLDEVGWPPRADLRRIFTGNVELYRTTYAPTATALWFLKDAADSEFPRVHHVYINERKGVVPITNATKALLIAVLNAGLGLAVAFGVSLSDAQTAAILGFGNALLALIVALTYKNSPTRIPDA